MSDESEAPISPTEEPAEAEVPMEAATFPTLEEMGTLLPQYEFHDILGIGGMGAVYLARQTALDRWVAIKLLPASASLNEEDAARFITEARSMARLTHAHIAAVHDFGQTSQGQLYLVMEHVNGLDLHRVIQSGELTQPQIRSLVTQLCDALQYAHQHGVVHRDIKPANILIAENWQAKIVDFGLARDRNADASGGDEYGTPDYVAPERLQTGAQVDHRADIYALGIVIHEMFTGLTPQAAGAAAGQNLPPEFASVVSRCMMVDPARRFQQCSEIKAFLNAVAIQPAVTTAPVHRPPPPHLQARVRPQVRHQPEQTGGAGKWVWAAACIALLVVGGWFVQKQRTGGTTSAPGETQAKAKSEPQSPESKAEVPRNKPQTPEVAAPTVVSSSPGEPFKPEAGDFAVLKRLKGHTELVYANAILPDQSRAISGGHDDTLQVWDLASGTRLRSYPSPVGDVHGIAANPENHQVLVWSYRTDQVAILDVDSGQSKALIKSPTTTLTNVVWSGDFKSAYLLCGDANGGVYHWDPAKGAVLQQFSEWPRAAFHVFPLPVNTSGSPSQLLVIGSSMKPGTNQAAGTSPPPMVPDKAYAALFSVPDHHLIRPLPDYTNIRNRLSLSPDGSTILGGLGTLYLLDVPDLKTRHNINPPPQASTQASAWTAAGRLIVAGYSNGSLHLFEADTGTKLAETNIGVRANQISVSKDSQWLTVTGFPLDMNHARPEDFDVFVVRLPDLGKLGTDQGIQAFAARQIAKLNSVDPELAELRSKAVPPGSIIDDDQLRTQVLDLTTKYGAALKRSVPAGSPKEQIDMNAEADAIAKGMPVPDASTDPATSGEHKRLRGIYRQQLAQLETKRQETAATARQTLEVSVKSLAAQRQQAGNRVGEAMCNALLTSLGDPKPFATVVASAFSSSGNAAAPSPAPAVAAAAPPRASTPPAPITPLVMPPPAATTPTASSSSPKIAFSKGVRTDVTIGRPSRVKGGDFDDVTQVITPKIKLTNTTTQQVYSDCKAMFFLIGESAAQRGIYKVMLRHDFDVVLSPAQALESEAKSIMTQYDTTGATFGYKYDGWALQVTDSSGVVVLTKSTSPTLEKMAESIKSLQVDQCYDRRWKPVANAPY